MYLPKHFEETRIDVMHGLMQRHSLGTLIAWTSRGLEANHVPFIIDAAPAPNGTLRCHVARSNSIWRALSSATEVLVVFQGADAYISPSAYPTKRDDARVVPTWDYIAVHAYGVPRVITDKRWLRQLVEDLTRSNEAARRDPWQVADAPVDYIDKLLSNIVGIEIPLSKLTGKWKISQNRSATDRAGVIADLRQQAATTHTEMAALIERTL